MDLSKLSEPLRADQIDFRVQSISEKGWAIILPYKDARCDQIRLDEAVGQLNWQRTHSRDNANCMVGIYDKEKDQWIWKEDTGTESNTEAEKGLASDSFKRACFNWGIGRELYDYPLIMVQLNSDEFKVESNGNKKRGKATFKLKLKEWIWHNRFEDGVLVGLSAIDDKGNERYKMGKRVSTPAASDNSSQAKNQADDKPWYNDFDNQKDWFVKEIGKGKTPDQLIKKLEEKYKINKKVREEIVALAKK